MRVLVTGGAGYIGSHTLIELLAEGHHCHVVDNLCNSSAVALERVARLSNRSFGFTRADLCDAAATAALVRDVRPDAVIHFAGLKAVGESCAAPMRYYRNNLVGTMALIEALADSPCRRLVFSSSATVYGDPQHLPIAEDHPLNPTNPYGRTKLQIEQMLADLAASDPSWSVALLRYFNPVGAHASGQIGEDPAGVPNNLMPYIAQVAVGRRASLSVFGDDYDTRDGTGVRDYIHVVDLARAHAAAMDWTGRHTGCRPFNLGTGHGCSVLEMVGAFQEVSGRPIPTIIAPRRAGDVAEMVADPTRAERELGWSAERSVREMCESVWHWQSTNPHGYEPAEQGRTAGRATAATG